MVKFTFCCTYVIMTKLIAVLYDSFPCPVCPSLHAPSQQ